MAVQRLEWVAEEINRCRAAEEKAEPVEPECVDMAVAAEAAAPLPEDMDIGGSGDGGTPASVTVALIDCYGQHRRSVTRSNMLFVLWPTQHRSMATGTL